MSFFSKKNKQKKENIEEKNFEFEEEYKEIINQKNKKSNTKKIFFSTIAAIIIAGTGYFAYVSSFDFKEMQIKAEKAWRDIVNKNYSDVFNDIFSQENNFNKSAQQTKRIYPIPIRAEIQNNISSQKVKKPVFLHLHMNKHNIVIQKSKKNILLKNDMKKIFDSVKEQPNSKNKVNATSLQISTNLKNKLSVPDSVEVEKKHGKIKIIFNAKEQSQTESNDIKKIKSNVEKIQKQIQLLKKSFNFTNQYQKLRKDILSKVDTKILNLKKNLKNQLNKTVSPIKESVKQIGTMESQNAKTLSLLSNRIQILEKKYAEASSQISKINEQIKNFESSLKNVNKDTIKKLENLVTELNRKTQDLQTLNKQINKIKQVFQDNIRANIKLAKRFDLFKQKLLTLEYKVNEIISTKITAVKNAQNDNIANTEKLTKKDYINTFGFYYAGYSENEKNGPVGYISDSKGKIYELQIGDIINNRYKIVDIKPLYLKLKDLENGKNYIISYKE